MTDIAVAEMATETPQNETTASPAKDADRKGLFIHTWGCQMNVYDSARMADTLAPQGYALVEKPDEADLVILNTCHIREKATEKVFSELGRLNKIKQKKQGNGDDMMIAVAGCVAQAEGDEITLRAPYVDMVFGPQTYHDLPDMIGKVKRHKAGLAQASADTDPAQASAETATNKKAKKPKKTGARLVNTDFPPEAKFDHLPEESKSQGPAAFLSVQEGCDKFCTFCVVPYTRGAEYSRPVTGVIQEARRLIANGTKEITLLGQNVNAYHGEGPDGKTWDLARLIRELADIDGLSRLRYTTSHPRDMNDDLIRAHAEVDALMPYLHLPIQSGSDRILEAMNRKHKADDYRRIIDKLRDARPEIALSSDFIVGFPGETDKDFADTLNIVNYVGYQSAYSFKYSPRPGTPAATNESQVDEAVKSERLQSLQQLLNAQQESFNHATLGKRMSVLLEKKGSREGQLHGRSPYMQAVHVQASERLIGEIVEVEITNAFANSVSGTIMTADHGHLSANNGQEDEKACCGGGCH